MPALVPIGLRAVLASVVACCVAAGAAAQTNLGSNPTVASGATLTLNAGDFFTGTLTVGTAGQNNGFLYLAADYTSSNAFVFTGTNSQLTYNSTPRTLTLTSSASLTRTGAGNSTFFNSIDNAGIFTVNGGTLFSNASFTNQTGGNVTVTGSGSILRLNNLTNAGTLTITSSGLVQFTGNLTTGNLGAIALSSGGAIEFANGSVLNNTGATLNAPTGGAYLFNGTITGGNITATALTQSSGILDGATVTGSFSVPAGAQLTLKNAAGWLGTLTVGTGGQNNGFLYLGTDITTDSSLVFTGTNSQLTYSSTPRTLTLTSNATLTRTGAGNSTFFDSIVNSGNVTVSGGTLFSNGSFTNQVGGNVTVTGSGSILNLSNLTNSGMVLADVSGLISLTGNFTTSNLGSIAVANGGNVEFANGSTLNNTAATLAAPTGGAYVLKGTILGGTVNANALTQSSGVLDGVFVNGSFAVLAGAQLTLKNTTDWTGTLTVGTGGQNNGFLYLGTDLTTNGALLFTGSNSQLTYSSTPRILTLTSSATLTRSGAGNSTFFDSIVNSGAVTVSGGTLFSNGAFTNQPGATTLVTGAGSILNLQGLTNSGSITSDAGGLLKLSGNFTTSGLGTITLTNNGTAELATGGTLNNTGTTLIAPTGGAYLFNGTIVGGNVTASALTQSSGVLDSAIVTSSFTVPGGTQLTLKNTAGWLGTLTVGTAGQNNGFLYLGTDISTDSALVFTGSNSQLTYSSTPRLLTLTANATLTRTGVGNSAFFDNLSNSGKVAVNGGTLNASGNFTNQAGGNVTVSSGAIFSQTGTFTNSSGATALVTGTGSKLAIANIANSGSILSDASGLLSLTGNFTTAGLGSITLTNGGTVELAANSTLNNTSANLLPPTGGAYLFNGTVSGGTIDPTALAQSAGTLDNGATISGNLTVANGQTLTLKNGGGWTGSATIGVAGQNNGFLYLGTDTTLNGGLVFTGSNSQLTYNSTPRILTLTSNATLLRTGAGNSAFFDHLVNAGTVTVNGGTLNASGNFTNSAGGNVTVSNGAIFSQTGTFTNATGATALVSGTGSKLTIANVNNAGSLLADSAGLLSLTGNFTTAGLGSITLANGGTVELAANSTLNNASANLLPPTGGAYLFNGTISGGTIAASALAQSAGTLDNGATIAGNLAVVTGQSLTLKNGGGWTGTATIGTPGQNNGFLYLGTDTTLDSALVFTGSNSLLTYNSSPRILTLTSNATLLRTGAGNSTFFDHLVNAGTVTVNGGTLNASGNFTNSAGGNVTVSNGAIFSQTGAFTNSAGATALVTGASSALAIANVTNSGTLLADLGGLLSLTGSFSTANLGSITLTNGGTVELATNSTLNNTSANLLPATGGAFVFKGTISGGTIDPTALLQNSGTLDNGATLTGNLSVANGQSLTLKNGGGWTGTATVGVAGQNNGFLYLGTDTTLNNGLVFTGTNSQLTYPSSPRILTVSSTGSLTRTGAGGSTSSFNHIVNAGAVSVTGGTFFSSGNFTNQAGGFVSVSSNATFTQSSNAFVQTGGALKVDGTFNPGSAGLAIQGGSVSGIGTLTGNTTFTGGTLDPGNPTGTLTFSGNLILGPGATTLLEIGNASSDRIAGIGNLTFGGTLNILPLTAALSAGQSWNLFGFTTSSGSFSNISLPYTAQGWIWDTSQLQTNGLLTLTTVVPIPEPSTYLLLASGLVTMFVCRRRKL